MYPLQQLAKENPGKIALLCDDHSYSFADLWQKAIRLAQGIRFLVGSSQPKRIGLLAENSERWIFAAHAIWLTGNTLIALPVNWRDEQIEREINTARVDLVLCDEQFLNRLSFPNRHSLNLLSVTLDEINLEEFEPAKPVLLLYTSGSSGHPKRVALSWQALQSHAKMSQEHLQLKSDDRWLLTLPLYHIGGVSALIKQLVCGFSIVVPDNSNRLSLTEIIERQGVTRAAMVPTTLERLFREQPEYSFPQTIRSILVGGGAARSELLQRDERLLATYGMSETGSQIVTVPLNSPWNIRNTCGKPLPGVRIEIRDEAGHRLQMREIGEIWVSSPALFDGYEDVPETATSLQNGWFRTGDFGFLDERNALTVVNRRSDRIVSGGENISPVEVENALLEIPDVTAAIVVGIPDREWGEVVAAVIVLERKSKATENSLRKALMSSIARYKIPKRWLILSDLPLLPTGKPDRQAIRDRFRENADLSG